MVFCREVPGGVEKDQTRKVAQTAGKVLGRPFEGDRFRGEGLGVFHGYVASLTGRVRLTIVVVLMKNSRSTRKPNLGVFHLSCWVLGLIGFIQLMAVGVAMAFRQQRVPEPVEKVVKEYVLVPSERRAPVTVAPQKPRPEVASPPPSQPVSLEPLELPDLPPLPVAREKEVLDSPPVVLDPVVEELLKEAADARIRGDLVLALTTLSDADEREANNPNVLYSMGVTYEELGVFDKAAEYFQRVWEAGPLTAESLYEKAALKLAHGLVPEVKGLAMLGWGRMANATRVPVDGLDGERRTLIMPVRVSQNKDFDPQLFTPRVRFYEEVDGKIGQAMINEGHSGSDWVTGVADWADGEEIAEVWYFVPDQDPASGLLFGQRKFYGFVAELYYDGRLVDIRAQPRTLLQEGGGESTMDELRRELNELDGLSLEDLAPAGPSVLPRIGDPFPDPDPEPLPVPVIPDPVTPDLPNEGE